MSLDESPTLALPEPEAVPLLPEPKAISGQPEPEAVSGQSDVVAPADAATPGAGTPAAQTASPQRDIYGLVQVGGRVLGIQAVHIREAVPFPETVSPMALSLPGLLGAMVLRQDTIPLVDMAVMLGLSTDLPMAQRVVIIVNDVSHQRLLGLVVDALQGMTSLDVSGTAEMCVVGRDTLLAGGRSFVHEGMVVGLLDPQLLFDQPSLPYALQRDRSAGRSRNSLQGGQQAYLLCNYQDHGLAIPVAAIQATIPMHPLQDSPLQHGQCDGVIEHHGTDIPIIDTLQLLGLGRNFSRPERSASVALRVPAGGLIAFEIDRFFDIVHTRAEDLLDMPAVLSPRSDLFDGVFMRDNGEHFFVLSVDKVLAEESVVQLASTTVADQQGEELDDKSARTGDAAARAREAENALYLVSCSAQKRMASLLTDIVEIMRLPDNLMYAEVRYDGYMGTISHRSQLIPIFSVGNLLGDFPFFEEGKACVLLFRVGQQLYGAAVEELEAVARCHPVGADADRVLRKMDDGAFLPLFDLMQELPVSGGSGGFGGGMSGGAGGGFLDAGELF